MHIPGIFCWSKRAVFLPAFAITLSLAALAAAEPKTLAVLTATADNDGSSLQALADRYAAEISRYSQYQLVERSKLHLVLSERELAQLGITAPRAAPNEGIVAAEQLVILSLNPLGDEKQVVAKRIDGKSAAVLRQSVAKAPDIRRLYDAIPALVADNIANSTGVTAASPAESVTPLQMALWSPLSLFPSTTTVAGIAISIFHGVQHKVLGIHAGLSNSNLELRGIGAGLVNRSQSMTGIQAGLYNEAEVSVSGIQAGLYNETTELTGFQFGLINRNKNGIFPILPILNFGFGTRKSETPAQR